MPKHSYQLINPVIEGTFKDVYDANKPIDGATQMWKSLTEHIVSHVPKFMFTMRNISTTDLHHFEVSENLDTKEFSISELSLDIGNDEFDKFERNVDDYSKVRDQDHNHTGGAKTRVNRKRYDDSSSSSTTSTSSSDVYPTIRRTSPIAMFHYIPRIYFTNANTYRYKSIMNPQLVAIQTPVITPIFTPIFAPIFRPTLGTFIGIYP